MEKTKLFKPASSWAEFRARKPAGHVTLPGGISVHHGPPRAPKQTAQGLLKSWKKEAKL